MNGQNAQYMVCRLAKVTFGFMINMEVQNPDKVCFLAPWLGDPIKVFTDKEDAIAYRNERNVKLHDRTPDENGRITIDTTPVETDWIVLDLETMSYNTEE